MLDFRFTKRFGESSSSQFFDVMLLSERFAERIIDLVSGKSTGTADVFCEYYDPDQLDYHDDQTPYEGVKFSVLDQGALYPPQIVELRTLYDLVEQACQFHIEDYPNSKEAEELLTFVQRRKNATFDGN